MSCDVGDPRHTPVFWDSACSLCLWESLPQVHFQNFTLFFVRDHIMVNNLVVLQKYTFLRMSCIPLWGIQDILDAALEWRPCTAAYHIKSHTPHRLLALCALTHLHRSWCCFKPTQYDPELSFPITHSLLTTPIKEPAYWPTRAKTHQEKGKWVRESNQILLLYLCSTRCIQNWNSLN